MSAAVALPQLRDEFVRDRPWGALSSLRRYEFQTADVPGEVVGISPAMACIHAARASLILRVGGGHLETALVDLIDGIAKAAPAHLDEGAYSGPYQFHLGVVSWLEKEQRSGMLKDSYTTATLVVCVSDTEIWTWLTSPHGVVRGPTTGMHFASTDLRYPVLRQLHLMREPPFVFPGAEPFDRASSIGCVGTPDIYERIRSQVVPGEVVIALDRASLPFGPWPKGPTSLPRLWDMDAAWRHGVSGRGVAVGHVNPSDLALPPSWILGEVSFGGG